MHELNVSLPAWVLEKVDYTHPYPDDESRMRLAIRLSAENVERGTGGPFGAAIFERESGILVGVGVNQVVRLNNSTLHAEMVAYQMAQKRIISYTLGAEGHPAHELFTSCAPCAMCLGGAHWSGITRLVAAAERDDAEALGFDEGPVFEESWEYLAQRGMEIQRGFLREEARAVLARYAEKRGEAYNG
jgi:tRNA(Arg) A34 adenosine deaminase TadA